LFFFTASPITDQYHLLFLILIIELKMNCINDDYSSRAASVGVMVMAIIINSLTVGTSLLLLLLSVDDDDYTSVDRFVELGQETR